MEWTQDRFDKVRKSLKTLQSAVMARVKAEVAVQDAAARLKNETGLTGNNVPKLEEETRMMLGDAALNGFGAQAGE